MKIEQYVVGSVQTNCYFVINEETKEMLLIDPGASGDALSEKITEGGYKPVAILLTHGHFDHAGASEELAQKYDISIYAHEAEEETLKNPKLNLSGWDGVEKAYHADVFVKDQQELDLAGFHIRVFHTPGHTVGGCCYYLPYENVVFSGDSLFCGSVGRTDFPRGSMADLVRTVKEKLMTLPGETTVYPGHNDITSIEQERIYNPYI